MATLTDAKTPDDIQTFLDANGGIAVVDCYANWCGPCKHIAPYLHKKHQQTKIPLITINVDQAQDLTNKYEVKAMPTFLVVKGKWDNVLKTIIGGGEHNVDLAFQTAQKYKH